MPALKTIFPWDLWNGPVIWQSETQAGLWRISNTGSGPTCRKEDSVGVTEWHILGNSWWNIFRKLINHITKYLINPCLEVLTSKGIELIQFLALLSILYQDDMKYRMNCIRMKWRIGWNAPGRNEDYYELHYDDMKNRFNFTRTIWRIG